MSAPPFPSLQARGRTYEPQGPPASETRQATGWVVARQHGSVPSGVPINLELPALLLADAEQISDHYRTVGAHEPFQIPATVWQSHSSLYDVTPANQAYRYAAPPARVRDGVRFTVSVTLITQQTTP